jgi:hypothetical protein
LMLSLVGKRRFDPGPPLDTAESTAMSEPPRRFPSLWRAQANVLIEIGAAMALYGRNFAIDGPLTTCVATVKATLNEIEASIAIQNEGFENLIGGSNVTMEQVRNPRMN